MEEKQKFNRLTVLETFIKDYRRYAKCICDCGKNVTILFQSLKSGHTKSCGCLQKELAGTQSSTHGLRGTKEYQCWSHIKDRCLNLNNKRYSSYAGRGITMCERWIHSFENFLADMGFAPTPQHSIDRIDNMGNYEPGNCRWATDKEQGNNRRTSLIIEYNGSKKTLAQWCRELGLKYPAMQSRLSKGWPVNKAFETPTKVV